MISDTWSAILFAFWIVFAVGVMWYVRHSRLHRRLEDDIEQDRLRRNRESHWSAQAMESMHLEERRRELQEVQRLSHEAESDLRNRPTLEDLGIDVVDEDVLPETDGVNDVNVSNDSNDSNGDRDNDPRRDSGHSNRT